MSVLVVDDEPLLLKLASKVLDRLGVKSVTTAQNGSEALALIEADDTSFDVILLDLNMPGMDGIELLRHLGERRFEGAVILLSGEDQRVLQTARQLGAVHRLRVLGAISKPISAASLRLLLQQARKRDFAATAGPQNRLSEAEIRHGLSNDAIVPYFQPKVDLKSGAIVGVETLARWKCESRGILGPGTFIPVAEECGLIDSLTRIIFAGAMTQAAEWGAAGLDLRIAVNFSVESLNDLSLVDFIVSCADENGIGLDNITVEVTESRLMEDLAAALEVLSRLRMKGVELSIDDFGTGYSSMEQLKRLPLSELKIDREFVSGASGDSWAHAILESSINLAHKLNMVTVAEGAETNDDWRLLAALGVDQVQGFLIARPMPGPDILGWRWSPPPATTE
ncbi:MAG: diguanylate phosphodiesterase [Rhodospirillaceae bacterium]|nr:diguanylate phosphodiesterase [Rhodospirillaceae bacterium]